MRSLISLVVVLAIVFISYKLYFSQLQSSAGSAAPARTIDVAGVKNDLIAIGQAERMYQAEHSAYATLDQLNSSGAMAIAKTGRGPYTYAAEPSDNGFRVEARCSPSAVGCINYAVDQTMEIRTTP